MRGKKSSIAEYQIDALKDKATVLDVANAALVDVRTVRRWITNDELPAEWNGKFFRVDREILKRWLIDTGRLLNPYRR